MNTIYFLNQIMGNVFKTKTSPALPSGFYLGLSTTAPTPEGACTEPEAAGTGYSRVNITSLLDVPADGVVKNKSLISFPESTADWGTATHYVVYDASVGGNLLFYGELGNSRAIEANTIVTIKPNELTITLSNG